MVNNDFPGPGHYNADVKKIERKKKNNTSAFASKGIKSYFDNIFY